MAGRPVAEPGEAAGDPIGAALQALQARGVDRRDPVRWHFVAALQRRTAQQHMQEYDGLAERLFGAYRRMLDRQEPDYRA